MWINKKLKDISGLGACDWHFEFDYCVCWVKSPEDTDEILYFPNDGKDGDWLVKILQAANAGEPE